MNPGTFYRDDTVHLLHGDVRGGLGALGIPSGSVAAVVTSPPYNVGIDYDGHADTLAWPDYRHLAQTASQLIAQALCEGGRVWLNVVPVAIHTGEPKEARQPLLRLWWQALEDVGLTVIDVVVWRAPVRAGSLGTAWGSWQSPSAPNLRGDWEAILIACKHHWSRQAPAGLEDWRDQLGGWERLCQNHWEIPTGAPYVTNGHPCPFPVELAARAIRLSTWPGETVLDPFTGTGTTLLAARILSREAIGIEQSARYCQLTVNRLAQRTLNFGGAA